MLVLFINGKHISVCKTWYTAWRTKYLHVTINATTPKYLIDKINKFNVRELYLDDNVKNDAFYQLPNLRTLTLFNTNALSNDDLLKYTNITSLKLIKNTSITNESLQYLTKITFLQLDYYDNLNKSFSFDFCTNIRTLTLTISDTYKIPHHRMYSVKIKEDNTGDVLDKFINVNDLTCRFYEHGYNIVTKGLKKLNNLTSIDIQKHYDTNNYTGLVVLRNLSSNTNLDKLTMISRDSSHTTYMVNIDSYSYNTEVVTRNGESELVGLNDNSGRFKLHDINGLDKLNILNTVSRVFKSVDLPIGD